VLASSASDIGANHDSLVANLQNALRLACSSGIQLGVSRRSMKANAWTGSAWGKGPATAADDQDYEGDDACGICLNAPEAVSLQPCKHKICAGCVDRLRYQLISTVGWCMMQHMSVVGWCMMQHMSSVCGAYKATGFDNDMHASKRLQAESGVKCPFCRGFVSDYKNAAE
jgi:Zinc finger, C3HC4 type (RING finger)